MQTCLVHIDSFLVLLQLPFAPRGLFSIRIPENKHHTCPPASVQNPNKLVIIAIILVWWPDLCTRTEVSILLGHLLSAHPRLTCFVVTVHSGHQDFPCDRSRRRLFCYFPVNSRDWVDSSLSLLFHGKADIFIISPLLLQESDSKIWKRFFQYTAQKILLPLVWFAFVWKSVGAVFTLKSSEERK